MGRTKNKPSRIENTSLGNCSLSTIGEFVPLFRGKRSKIKKPAVVPSYQVVLVEDEHRQYYLGDIRVGSTDNLLPENIESCKISFKKHKELDSVILNVNNDCVVIVQLLENIDFLKDFIQTKKFSFEIYTQDENNVYFKVYLTEIPLPKFHKKIAKCIQTAFSLFYHINVQDSIKSNHKGQKSLSSRELNEVYEKLQQKRHNFQYSLVQKTPIPYLKPVLRPYQEKSLQWMIYRETKANDLNSMVHPLYEKIQLKSGLEIYFDKYTGWLEKDPPLVKSQWKGGILADEMGLGKTVEVLALILSHRFDQTNCDSIIDESQKLVISNQPKKRKLDTSDLKYIEPKKLKTPEVVKKSSKKKSATYQALQTIYNRSLSEYCTTEVRSKREQPKVQCICGNNLEIDCAKCTICDKLQHKQCLGYKKKFGPYKCPQCWEKSDLIDSKATLIVTPSSLRRQWCREMKTHLNFGLNVLNYQGNSATPVYPTELQNYDIVITTYNVLQAEMRLTETGQSLNMRNARKYWPGGSPLVRVKWWRLCLDEAQTVESPGSLISLMAGKITACHRWAVTGTPIAKGLSDIYGLIDYLQMQPYNDPDTWQHILYDEYVRGNTEPMLEFLCKVLWRTTKDSVLDQINIPQQTRELHLVEFSAVEKFYYNRQHSKCTTDFLAISRKFAGDLALEKMDKSDLKNLMGPLLSLRQACSDPSIVRGKGRDLSLRKNTSSMKELLEALILKNKNDCEEKLRLIISSINGLAGIHFLMEDYEQAIHGYRKVLQLVAEFSSKEANKKLDIDKLPLIHTMHNLAEVLEIHQSKKRTLRDSTLKQDCAKLEKQYIEKFMKESAIGKEACRTISDTVEQLQGDFNLDFGQWYSDGFDWVTLQGLENELISKTDTAATNCNIDCDLRNETPLTLRRTVYNWHVTILESREKLFKIIEEIYQQDEETKQISIVDGLVKSAMDCHLRPQLAKDKTRTSKCKVCLANNSLKNYEKNLFTMRNRAESCEEMALIGSWKQRLEEFILKALLGLLKSKNSEPDLIKDGETHMQLIDVLKKEFKEIRKVWTLLDRQVCAQDELDICKVRYQLKSAKEASKTKTNRDLKNLNNDQSEDNTHHLIPYKQLPHQELSFKSDEIRYNAELQALLGTRNYLDTLNQQQFEGSPTDPCPICRGPLQDTWVILPCAHTYCLECFQTLLKKNLGPSNQINCCVCRVKHNVQEVGYIKGPNVKDETGAEQTQVVGDFSKKIEATIQLLLNLKKHDPYVKVLLFSTWPQVLKLLKKAFAINNIKSEIAEASASLEKPIEAFKNPIEKITVLLLPIKLGSRGLNLIEATHVILLEPVLNPADELQAIGRVHRIGQTKQTVVHKFLVKDTVEEALHNATSSNASEWEKGKITVGMLNILFKNNNLEAME